jgi:hypothetical protein
MPTKPKLYRATYTASDGLKGYGEGETAEEARAAAICDAHDRPAIEGERRPIIDTDAQGFDDTLLMVAFFLIVGLGAFAAWLIFGAPDLSPLQKTKG